MLKYRFSSILLLNLILLLLFNISGCKAGPEPINYGHDECEFCRMQITDNRYGSEIVNDKGKVFKFDEVGCMIEYSMVKNLIGDTNQKFLVTDFAARETFIDATDAFFVQNDNFRSPMGSNAHVWTELWRRVTATPVAGLYRVPFNPADPVNTPRGLGTSQAVRDRVLYDLAATVKYFGDNGIPLEAEWGTIHFDERNGERIPIHGGQGTAGVYNAITPALPAGRAAWEVTPKKGYAPIAYGSSYIQAVTFGRNGPDARALVTYSVSSDPESPHYADMTKLFSSYGWVNLPFNEGDIRRDPNLEVLKLHEKR